MKYRYPVGVSRATSLQFGGSQTSLAPGTNKIGGVLSASATPNKTLVLDAGTFSEDFSLTGFPATWGQVVIQGSGTGMLDTTSASTAATLEAGQSVIAPTKEPASQNQVGGHDVLFRQVVFDLSNASLATNKAIFSGSNNTRLWFDRCSVINALTQMTLATGPIGLDHIRHVLSSDAPASPIVGGWKIPTSISARDVVVDGAYSGSSTSPFGVDVFGSSTSGITYGDWFFEDCHMFPGGANSIDAAYDFEFGSATAGPRVQILGGSMSNSKIYFVGVPYLYIGGGFLHRVNAITPSAGSAMVIDATTSGTAASGILEVDGAMSWYDDFATATFRNPAIFLSHLNYIQAVRLTNFPIITNGHSTAGGGADGTHGNGNIPIYIVAPTTASGNFIDEALFDNVPVAYTSLPTVTTGSYSSVVQIGAQATATAQRVTVAGSGIRMLGTQSAAAGLPAGVNPTTVGNILTLGFTGKSPAFTTVEVDGLDCQLFNLANPTSTSPQLFTLAGTPTFSQFFYGLRNRTAQSAGVPGSLANSIKQTVNAGIANLLTYKPPANGLFEAGFNLILTPAVTSALNCTVTYTDGGFNGTSKTPQVTLNTPASGAAAGATTANTAGSFSAFSYPFWAKGGVNIVLAVAGTSTSVTYDATGYLRQVA